MVPCYYLLLPLLEDLLPFFSFTDSMNKISGVVITFNEEANIARCLKSLTGLVDEIIVVDSFSTDRTVEIAKSFSAKVILHAFEGYVAQKQWAVGQAANDYILSLDADEALCPQLFEAIARAKQGKMAQAYTLNRLTYYLGKPIRHCGWYPDQKLRLWDRRFGSWGGVDPHDKVVMGPGVQIQHLSGDLLHYSYYSIGQHVAQFNHFTDIGANEAFKKGKKSHLLLAIFKGIWKFKRDYIFKLGFLDGYYGFVICSLGAFATYAKYLKLRELRRNSR